jgi:hypothetical protein
MAEGPNTEFWAKSVLCTEIPPDPLSTIPFPRDPDYVRRGPLIDQLHAKLSVPGARVALVGLGGVG